ncbi:hypothetical protein V1515DRAFT_213579 [Lipomyces mesembrius]
MQAESSESASQEERVLLQPHDKLPEIGRGNTFKTKDDLLNNMSMVAFAHGFFYSVYERTALEETGLGPASGDRIMFICSTSEGSPNLCPWTMTATASSGSENWTVTAVCKTHLHVVFPLVGVSLQKFLHLSMANKLRSLSFKSNDVEGPFTSDVRDGNRVAMGADGKELDRDAAATHRELNKSGLAMRTSYFMQIFLESADDLLSIQSHSLCLVSAYCISTINSHHSWALKIIRLQTLRLKLRLTPTHRWLKFQSRQLRKHPSRS